MVAPLLPEVQAVNWAARAAALLPMHLEHQQAPSPAARTTDSVRAGPRSDQAGPVMARGMCSCCLCCDCFCSYAEAAALSPGGLSWLLAGMHTP